MMSSKTLTQLCSERRLKVLLSIARPQNTPRLFPVHCRLKSSSSVTIGDVTKELKKPNNPELVPSQYLPKDKEIPRETLKHLKWMLQKDLLGQDIFLIGPPSPLRRSLAMQYLELTQRELEYVALSRDTTESDLKQRREISGGTASYIDQSAVKAASEGRILVLEGIEKAERNVLPVLNNLLENREMHLEDGRLLIPAARYDKLLEEHSQAELDKWQLVRVSEDFRVIALGLPVPKYVGNPLDPPLRSRFQGRDIRHLPFSEQLKVLQTLAPNLNSDKLSQLLSYAHTLVTEESSNLGLADFPVENLPALVTILNQAPALNSYDAINRLYPYTSFLPVEGCQSVEGTMETFQLGGSSREMMGVEAVRMSSDTPGKAEVDISIDGRTYPITAPCGPHPSLESNSSNSVDAYVSTAYHDRFLSELLLSHSAKDFCIIGPKGCGKSVVLQQLADLLGYETEPIMLYQDMTARDLLQQRTTTQSGDTVWRYSPLVTAALEGKMAVLDGVHRIHRGTLAVLHRLVHDKELQLYDGTRLISHERYEHLKTENKLTDDDMSSKKILPISPHFRIAALAEPPVIGGSSKEQWLTPEILSMFLFHQMRPLSQQEEYGVIQRLTGGNKLNQTMDDILRLTHRLRDSDDASLKSIANSLSTRQLLRVARRLQRFPGESVYASVQKACLARFLPSLPREALDAMMGEMGVTKPEKESEQGKEIICNVENGMLTLGQTSAPVYNPETNTKVPETLFYDTVQNIATLEQMLQDFLLGEHLLLVGNQGVGKNKVVDRMLNLLNRPREYIQLHRDTTVQSLTLQPTVKEGVILYEDSPLVKAVKTGNILVVDEADKAPTHVTCILKTLVESGEMILSDGRRIVPPNARTNKIEGTEIIRMHPDFRMMVLANRPGFPFLGNDFFGSLGDLFSCHAIDNPSMDSELSMLRQYGPSVSEDVLRRLVKAFSELRDLADEGQIQYPYSTREVVNIVKHLERFPSEGLGGVVRNVFDFDSYEKEARESVEEVLHKHGIPIGTSASSISLGREFELPKRELAGHWQIGGNRPSGKTKFMALPIATSSLKISGPQQVNMYKTPLDRVEARGLGFSELQSYFSLPFNDFAVVGDVCIAKDKHKRQLYDTIHVATSNPVWLFSMVPSGEEISKLNMNHFFDTRKQNVIPRLKVAPLGGNYEGVLAVHDEVSGTMVLAEPDTGTCLKVEMSMLESVKEFTKKIAGTKGAKSTTQFYRMVPNFSQDNKLLFYTPNGNAIELLDLSKGSLEPETHKIEVPFNIESLHPLSADKYLVVAAASDPGMAPESANLPSPGASLYILRKEDPSDPIPSHLTPISQSSGSEIASLLSVAPDGGLSDFGLQRTLDEKMSTPNTLMATGDSYATLVLGFPELEFSQNEVYSWPKTGHAKKASNNVPTNSLYAAKKYIDKGKNFIFLKESCQIVRPVNPHSIPAEFARNNHGMAAPGNVSAFLEVVDLISNRLRYIPIPEPAQMSVYASWYKQTYPDQLVSLTEMSNEGLVTVDNAGTVRLWETGVANLNRSYNEWQRMLGEKEGQLTIERDKVGDLDSPKHGKLDPDNQPHIGGNTWAGGVGGRDTAGMGGMGGPYRLDAGHDVHQLSDEVKAQVPEHIRKAAREMNRKAFEERLREIQMSEYDADLYSRYATPVRKQVTALKTIISALQAKTKDRQWLKNQTSGELDDTRLIEGITGEKSIYKKRGEHDPEPGAPQEKPKRLRVLVDVSGSMYRFNGHDQRLERMMESALMVMEALDGYGDKFKYDIIGHSGEDKEIIFVEGGKEPKNEKERLEVLRLMNAHAQFCMSGDHTLPATAHAITSLGRMVDEHDESFVIVLSDANFDRYGISPATFAKILKRNDQVDAFAIFIGSLGDQADQLAKKLPSGKGFVCLDTKKIPEVMKTIFTSTMLK